MFKNLINLHDGLDLLEKIKQKKLHQSVSGVISSKKKKVEKSWEHTQNPPTNWWDIPAVRERWNFLISGNVNVDYCDYFYQKYLSNKESLIALSLACGTGHRELRWVELGKFKRIDAYDLSKPRIEFARNKAKEKGCGGIINYCVGNVYDIEQPKGYYDIIFGEMSLHHFSPLKDILWKVNNFLKTDGYFIVNEFVGPTRFQWTDRQLKAINGLLSVLPKKYRGKWNSNDIKSGYFRPGRLRMILGDPSEAVESARIMPLLKEIFNVVEVKGYGGTILQMLFSNIAHNFLGEDEETQRYLRLCFEAEDLLLRSGDIQNDFVVAICKKRINND